MIITTEYLDSHKTSKGAWTRKQIEALDIKWPLESGWKQKVIGLTITDKQRGLFEDNKSYSDQPNKKIGQAIRLLKSNGYIVFKGGLV